MSQIDNHDQSHTLSDILERVDQLAKKVASKHQDSPPDIPLSEPEPAVSRSSCCPPCECECECECESECCPPKECCPPRGISLDDVMQAIADMNKVSR